MTDQSEANHFVLWGVVKTSVWTCEPIFTLLENVEVLHPKYTGQSHFPWSSWTCSKNTMSVSVFFSDKFCHVFDWNFENSNYFFSFCGKFHQILNIKELKQITLVKGSYYLLRNLWCPVKFIQVLSTVTVKNSTLSLSLIVADKMMDYFAMTLLWELGCKWSKSIINSFPF